jgi:hypothetical protein
MPTPIHPSSSSPCHREYPHPSQQQPQPSRLAPGRDRSSPAIAAAAAPSIAIIPRHLIIHHDYPHAVIVVAPAIAAAAAPVRVINQQNIATTQQQNASPSPEFQSLHQDRPRNNQQQATKMTHQQQLNKNSPNTSSPLH